MLATDGSNITMGAAESIVYEAFSDSEFSNEDPAKSIILIGPQITGPLPQTIRPGDYVTLLGRNFSADVSQDKVCIQGLCVAPQWSTPTAMGFRVPEVFQDLDVPVKAFVTVDNGRYMSGPAPGRSMLEKRYWVWGARWGSPDWAFAYPLSCSAAANTCQSGRIHQGLDGLFVTMKSSDGAKAGYKLEGQVADWSPSLISADVSPEVDVSGNPSLTPAGRSTNLSFGIIEDNAMALVETRVRASLELDASVAANAYFSNYLSSSKDKSRQKLLYSEQPLGDGRIPTKVMLSADHALSGFEASLGSGGSETLFASRQLSSFAGAIGSDNAHPSDFLPGRGGLISAVAVPLRFKLLTRKALPLLIFRFLRYDWPNAAETYFRAVPASRN